MNRNRLNDSSLICITRDDPSLNHFEQVKIFVNAGARLIQLRAKFLSPNELYEQAKPAVELTKKHDCQLIINDHYQLVSDIDADGVHLGMNDAPVEYVRRVLSPKKLLAKQFIQSQKHANPFPINPTTLVWVHIVNHQPKKNCALYYPMTIFSRFLTFFTPLRFF